MGALDSKAHPPRLIILDCNEMQPQLPIDVDAKTGAWTTDVLPRPYMPRHFLTNNHAAIEEARGRNAYEELLYTAGYESAYHWCAKEAEKHGLAGMAVFEHYLKRLSKRGWGRFSIIVADPASVHAMIESRDSPFLLAHPGKEGKLCNMFAGWFAGTMDCVNDTTPDGKNAPRAQSKEVQCAEQGHDRCLFEVSPIAH